MKTIILTLIICFVSTTVSFAQNIEKIFGNDLTKNRHLSFTRSSDSLEVFLWYDASKRAKRKSFFLVCEEKGISCLIRDNGTIKKAYIDFLIKEKNENIPEIVFSAELAKDDAFINYYIRPIVDDLLNNIENYTRIEYHH